MPRFQPPGTVTPCMALHYDTAVGDEVVNTKQLWAGLARASSSRCDDSVIMTLQGLTCGDNGGARGHCVTVQCMGYFAALMAAVDMFLVLITLLLGKAFQERTDVGGRRCATIIHTVRKHVA